MVTFFCVFSFWFWRTDVCLLGCVSRWRWLGLKLLFYCDYCLWLLNSWLGWLLVVYCWMVCVWFELDLVWLWFCNLLLCFDCLLLKFVWGWLGCFDCWIVIVLLCDLFLVFWILFDCWLYVYLCFRIVWLKCYWWRWCGSIYGCFC